MVQIDISLSASVGATLAVAAHRTLKEAPRLFWNGYLAGAVVFTAFFVVPAVLFFLQGWPSWDTMYWYDRETVPLWLPPVSVVLVLAASGLGFLCTHALIRRGARRASLAMPALLLLPAFAVLGVFHDRVLHVGTGESYAGGAPVNLFSSDLLWALIAVIVLYVGLPLGLCAARLAKRR